MEEFARENPVEAERQAERKRQRIRLLEEAVRYDALAFDPPAAVAKLPPDCGDRGDRRVPDALSAKVHVKAIEFYERGRDKGDNPA